MRSQAAAPTRAPTRSTVRSCFARSGQCHPPLTNRLEFVNELHLARPWSSATESSRPFDSRRPRLFMIAAYGDGLLDWRARGVIQPDYLP